MKRRDRGDGRGRTPEQDEIDRADGEPGPAPESADSETEAPAGEAEGSAKLAAEYLDQLQRMKAEFDNYRKRVAREREEWFQVARGEVLSLFLAVLDDVRRAREHARDDEPPDPAGLLMILKRFEEILAQLGLEEQSVPPGSAFDPERQEAVLATPSSEIPEGGVVRTLEPGYLLRGRLLRPSKVAVSSGPAPESR